MSRGLIRTRAYPIGVALLITAGLLLIEPQTDTGASTVAPQGKGGAIKPVPTVTSAPKKAKPPEGKKPKSSASKISEPSTTAKSNADQPAVTISTMQSLRNYDSSVRDSVYKIVLPNVNANSLSVKSGSGLLKNGSRGTGFDNLQLEQQGNDAVLSFRLKSGAYARVKRRTLERFEKLEIFISVSKEAKNVSVESGDNQNTEVGVGKSNTAAISPDAYIVLPCSGMAQDANWIRKPFEQKGALSEISSKKKVFLNKSADRIGEKTTLILKQYGGLEIAESPPHAEFVLNYCSWHVDKKIRTILGENISARHSGLTLVVTIRDPLQGVPRVIWQEESEETLDGTILAVVAPVNPDAAEKLTKRFVSELKKVRGDLDWDEPFLRDDAEILLPKDFRKRESEYEQRNWTTPLSSPLPRFGQEPDELLPKPLNTSGSLSDISNKRKVFVNFTGPIGDKIIAKLGTYGGLEVVKSAAEADLAVNLYYWEREERSAPQGPFGEQTVKDVTGATMIVTIRDSAQRIPRIVWRNDDTDGGWLKRGEAYDKLIKRFITEVKKLRGER